MQNKGKQTTAENAVQSSNVGLSKRLPNHVDMTSLAELLSGTLRGQNVPLSQRTINPPNHSSPHTSALRDEPLWPRLRAHTQGHHGVSATGTGSTTVGSVQNRAFSKQGGEDGACMFALRSAKWLEGGGKERDVEEMSGAEGGAGGKAHQQLVFVKVSGGGTKLRDGTLQLTPHSAIVFDGSCEGVELKDLHINGMFWNLPCFLSLTKLTKLKARQHHVNRTPLFK